MCSTLADMSVDYVVRLEQGRSSRPSVQLLDALARALRLSDDERVHLFHLAGHQPPPADGVVRLASAGLIRMLDLLGDTPALGLPDLGEVLAHERERHARQLVADLRAAVLYPRVGHLVLDCEPWSLPTRASSCRGQRTRRHGEAAGHRRGRPGAR